MRGEFHHRIPQKVTGSPPDVTGRRDARAQSHSRALPDERPTQDRCGRLPTYPRHLHQKPDATEQPATQ